MRKIWLMAVVVALWSPWIVPASADELSGAWVGPWYRGMTSGTMTLQIESDGGMIQMTNLDGFPEDEVVLSKDEQAGVDHQLNRVVLLLNTRPITKGSPDGPFTS